MIIGKVNVMPVMFSREIVVAGNWSIVSANFDSVFQRRKAFAVANTASHGTECKGSSESGVLFCRTLILP
jgi:hypothetical protein